MKSRDLVRLAIVAAVAVLLGPGTAMAQLTRGTISGTVRDEQGAIVPGVTVTIKNVDTGIERAVTTNALGFYRAAAIEPGNYTVRFELPGFAVVERSDVVVRTAIEVTVSQDLKVAPQGETLTVTARAEAITLNKSNPTVGLTISGRQAVELPLSAARNINNLALMSPNTFSAPGSTGISANGNRARNNNFTIDGSDNNDIGVTIQSSPVLPEAVAEYQVQTNPYNAEFGRNSGAQLNVITKSGTNSFHGEVWDYYRSSGMNALDNLEKASGLKTPPKAVRHQIGGTFGGPLVKDRTFFFGLAQRDTERTGLTLGTPSGSRIPTPEGFRALQNVPLRPGQSQASRQAILNSLAFLNDVYAGNATFRTLQTTLVNGVPIQTGLTNVGRLTPNTTWSGLGRIDHQLMNNSSLTLRYLYHSPEDTNAISNRQFGSLFSGNQIIAGHNAALSNTHIFNSSTLNELRVSYIQRDLQFPENDPKTPTTTITGLFTIGGASNFPQGRLQKSWQFQDVVTLNRSRHTFKLGADVRRINLKNDAAFDSKGTYSFNSLQDFMNNQAVTFAQALQVSSFVAKQWQTFLFAQDDFRLTPDLVLNLGLRYELSTSPFGFFGATDPESRAALVPGPVKRDTNNWAPRLGFAWSPSRGSGFFGDGRTVVRAGYGITYDVLFYNILTVNASNYPRVVVGRADNVLDVYPNVVPVSALAVFNPLATYVNSPEDLQNPKQHIYSLSLQREFLKDFTLELGYTGSTGRNGINQLQGNPATLTEAQAATVARTRSTLSIPTVQQRRQFPQFGSRVLIASTAKAQYHAGFLSLSKRMSHGLQFQLSYTLSRLMSDNDESLGVGDITDGTPQIPQDFRQMDVEYTRSAFDRPHRFSIQYTWEVPAPKSGGLKHLLGGWQFTGWTEAQAGQPFTILTGVDSNGNGAGGDRPNVNPGGTFVQTAGGKTFENRGYYVVPLGTNNLPLAFSLGNGNGVKNAHRSASYWNTNLSLRKRVELPRNHRVDLRVDAFNVFNQDEYGLPVTSMSSPTFGQNTRDWGNRNITLSVKYAF